MKMDKIELNIGTLNKCCFKCNFAREAHDNQFVRCIYHRFYPFRQFICRSYETRKKNWRSV